MSTKLILGLIVAAVAVFVAYQWYVSMRAQGSYAPVAYDPAPPLPVTLRALDPAPLTTRPVREPLSTLTVAPMPDTLGLLT